MLRRHEKLILEHIALVRRRAGRLCRKLGGELSEFEADGMVGLIEAAKRYRPSKNNNFAAYATQRIDGAILDGFRKWDPVGRHERAARRKDPTRAERTGHLRHTRRVDLDNPEDWDALMAVASDQVEELEKKYWREIISILPSRLKAVMRMYYFEGKTDPQVGEAIGGKTGSWACRLRMEAIEIIRDYLRKKGLLDGR
jgi:RNA polymerase sigma factor (sigma-70 family)